VPLKATLPILGETRLKPAIASYERALRSGRRQAWAVLLILACVAGVSAYVCNVSISKLVSNIGNFTGYFARIIPELHVSSFWTDIREWMWNIDRWAKLLADTLLMAYCGTLLGFAGGFALSFFAASNLAPHPAIGFAAKRFFEFCRSVPELVFALIFIFAFQLGPVPGVLAISLHTMGSLGKLFSEAVENVHNGPVESARACGAGCFNAIRFGVLPQVLPAFASYALLRFEINVRATTVIGFVGAGGIGQEFLEAIRTFQYGDVSAILALITLTVFAIDFMTERLRHGLIGLAGRP
jgi:phosphonate transport system permease protein